jgi:hypothetical protein
MATDPDRQSDGRPTPSRRKRLIVARGALHGVCQAAWALAVAAPLASALSALAGRPSASRALGVIEITGVWGLGAALGWAIRVFALCASGRFGAGVRERARRRAQRRMVGRW